MEQEIIRRLTGTTRRTPEGGYAVRLINNTGARSVKGTVVSTDTAIDKAVRVCVANSVVPFGVMYDEADNGKMCWVVISGLAEVLIKDGTEAVKGDWVGMSDANGRAYTAAHSGTTPPETAVHNRELGHCLESKSAGSDVLALIALHFN